MCLVRGMQFSRCEMMSVWMPKVVGEVKWKGWTGEWLDFSPQPTPGDKVRGYDDP